jgi:hypothetical protein
MIGDLIVIGLAFLAGYGAGAHAQTSAGKAEPTPLDVLVERAKAAHAAGYDTSDAMSDIVTP